jgi:peptide deformylase
MRIVIAPDPVLRQKCEPVDPAELPKLKKTAMQMAKTMYKNNGCGLAAPQVGLNKRLIVVDTGPVDEDEVPVEDPTFIVNPVVKRIWGEPVEAGEGCLSIPGITVEITRQEGIEIEALDLDGEPFIIEAEGFDARALQHELDHLDGITMFEHLDPIARIAAFKEYEAAKEAGAKPGDTSV